MPNLQKTYNPEIDGLRSIAVLCVIFFHFDIPGFSGGFIGVDIFFVISGFLISRLLLEEFKANQFSFTNFFIRRARRLFPALFFTLLATFVGGLILFSPEDMEKLSGSLVYALMSLSNIFFWMESGYFDTASELKPLLHTWSLSVEEQFYLFWPALLFFLHKKFRPWAIPATIFFLSAAGLLASELLISMSPEAAFYMSPLRVFEFTIGASIIWIKKWLPGNKWFNSITSLAGITLIIYSTYFFSKETPFPGLNALIPCIGTALLIHAGNSCIAKNILSSSIPVSIGKISYSLYLTHWPIFVYYKYILDEPLKVDDQAILLIYTLISGILIYNFIEKPFRLKDKGSTENSPAAFGLACALLTLTLVLPAADSWANKGWTWRFKDSENFLTRYDINDKSYVWDTWVTLAPQTNTKTMQKRFYLIGDSQAADMLNAISTTPLFTSLRPNIAVSHIQYFCGGVLIPPQKENNYYEVENKAFLQSKTKRDECIKQKASAFSADLLKNSEIIILSPFWYEYLIQYLPGTIDEIRKVSDAKIIIVGHKHMLASSTGIFRHHKSLRGIETAASKFIDPGSLKINEQLARISKDKDVLFFNPLHYLCKNHSKCKVVGRLGGPMMYDTHHLTPEGSEFMGVQFTQWAKENKVFN